MEPDFLIIRNNRLSAIKTFKKRFHSDNLNTFVSMNKLSTLLFFIGFSEYFRAITNLCFASW